MDSSFPISLNANVTITANVSDKVGVTNSPYSCVWHVPSARGKTYTLKSKSIWRSEQFSNVQYFCKE